MCRQSDRESAHKAAETDDTVHQAFREVTFRGRASTSGEKTVRNALTYGVYVGKLRDNAKLAESRVWQNAVRTDL
jgi:hypothetical protein